MIILLIIGMLLVFWGGMPYFKYLVYMPFERVDLENISVEIRHRQDGAYVVVDVYSVLVEYDYLYDGNHYKSNKVSFSGKPVYTDISAAERLKGSILNDKSCYVSCKKPVVSVLSPKVVVGQRNGRLAPMVAGVLLALCYFLLASL